MLQVVIKYCPESVDQFIEVADAIEDRFASLAVEGEEAEMGAGNFSIEGEDGELLLSGTGAEFDGRKIVVFLESLNVK
jgi:hypothetical protein